MAQVTPTTELQAAIQRARRAVDEASAYALWRIEEFQEKHERDYELLWKHYGELEVKEVIGEFELIWRGEVDGAGYIYCISDQQGHYKLGRTKNPQPRLKALGTQPPFKLTLLFTHYVYDAVQYEKRLHDHFKSKRMNGEWFELNEADLETLKTGNWVKA